MITVIGEALINLVLVPGETRAAGAARRKRPQHRRTRGAAGLPDRTDGPAVRRSASARSCAATPPAAVST